MGWGVLKLEKMKAVLDRMWVFERTRKVQGIFGEKGEEQVRSYTEREREGGREREGERESRHVASSFSQREFCTHRRQGTKIE